MTELGVVALALALVAGIVAIGAIALLGMKVSSASVTRVRREFFEVNRALATVAERTGLRFVGGGSWHHPIVGSMLPCDEAAPSLAFMAASCRGRQLSPYTKVTIVAASGNP